MKIVCLLALGTILGRGLTAAQEYVADGNVIERQPVPATVLADAVKAVQEVGEATLKGKFEEVIAKIYPRFLHRSAKKMGSEAALTAQLEKSLREFERSGMTITSFVADPAMHAFDIPEFNEWLVFVPTTRIVRAIDPNTGKAVRMEIKDYQIAILDKEPGSEWSFLNGSTLEVRELRALFPSLPATPDELGLPSKEGKILP